MERRSQCRMNHQNGKKPSKAKSTDSLFLFCLAILHSFPILLGSLELASGLGVKLEQKRNDALFAFRVLFM